ncbi:MAG: substrate binding domain-containing protein, partial [Rhizomicrobium sp.]
TEMGQDFYERAKQILADIAETEAVIGQQALQPAGLLHISVPMSFGINTLSDLLPDFCKRYPMLRLNIDLSDRLVDLVGDGFDVAVRLARIPSTNLIARKIAPVRMMVCAAPAYLETHGIPTAPSELRDHDFLGYGYLATGDDLVLTTAKGDDVAVRITPQVRASNGDVLRKLALAGLGITVLPDYVVGEDIARGRLTALLPGWSMNGFYLYAIYPKRDFLPIKVKVLIDYLVEKLGVNETTLASTA